MMSSVEALFSSQAHGYATGEFEVTVERLGVYLPVCILLNTPLGDRTIFIYLGRTYRQSQGLW